LDIDGVLNSHIFLYEEGGFKRQKKLEEGVYSRLDWDKAMLDERAIKRLAKVLEATNAKVCISSSWRLKTSLKEFIDIFNSYSFFYKPAENFIIDRTPYGCEMTKYTDYNRVRGFEILEWLEKYKEINGENSIEAYAVLDDSLDAGTNHEDYFVRTKWHYGLQDEHVEELLRILS